MKASLLFPRWTEVFGPFSKLAKKVSGFSLLNIAYLAAVAEKGGHKVQVINGEIEGLENQEIINRVKEFSSDPIGVTGTTPMFHLSVKLAKALKQRMDVPIMTGRQHVTLFKDKVFEDCFDFFFVSESKRVFSTSTKGRDNILFWR